MHCLHLKKNNNHKSQSSRRDGLRSWIFHIYEKWTKNLPMENGISIFYFYIVFINIIVIKFYITFILFIFEESWLFRTKTV